MDTNAHGNAATSLCLSILTTVLAWTIQDLEGYLRIGATIVAIASGILAARYYYYGGNKAKKDGRSSNTRKN